MLWIFLSPLALLATKSSSYGHPIDATSSSRNLPNVPRARHLDQRVATRVITVTTAQSGSLVNPHLLNLLPNSPTSTHGPQVQVARHHPVPRCRPLWSLGMNRLAKAWRTESHSPNRMSLLASKMATSMVCPPTPYQRGGLSQSP